MTRPVLVYSSGQPVTHTAAAPRSTRERISPLAQKVLVLERVRPSAAAVVEQLVNDLIAEQQGGTR